MTSTPTINQFCSEYFYCEECLLKDHKIVKGYDRYDSLVLCEKHNTEFQPIINKLREVLNK